MQDTFEQPSKAHERLDVFIHGIFEREMNGVTLRRDVQGDPHNWTGLTLTEGCMRNLDGPEI